MVLLELSALHVLYYPKVVPVESSTTLYKYYTSIHRSYRDKYLLSDRGYIRTDDYKIISEYIEEVCMINHIFPDDIHEGEYLTVPYYSAEYLNRP